MPLILLSCATESAVAIAEYISASLLASACAAAVESAIVTNTIFSTPLVFGPEL